MGNLLKKESKELDTLKKEGSLIKNLLTKAVSLIFIVMLILCVVVSIVLHNSLTKQKVNEIKQLSSYNANEVKGNIENMYSTSQNLASGVQNYKNLDPNACDSLLRSSLMDVLKNENIFSSYYAFEPSQNMPQYYAYRDGSNVAIDVYNDYENESQEEYYSVSKETKKVHITEPYQDELETGEKIWLVSISYPIINDSGEFIGVANCDMLAETFLNLDYHMGDYETTNNYIITEEGTYIVNTANKNDVGQKMKAVNKGDQEKIDAVKNKTKVDIEGVDSKTKDKCIYVSEPIKINGIEKTWSSQFSINKSEAYKSVYSIILIFVLVCLGGIVILTLLGYKGLRKTLSPVKTLVEKIENMGKGNLSVEKSEIYANDELGKLTKINEKTADTLSSYIAEISEVLSQISTGNLNLEVSRDYIGDFEEIKTSLNEIINSMNDVFTEMNMSSEQVFEGAAQVSDGAQALSQGATEQASSIEELSSTINEITSQIETNAKNAEKAKSISIESGEATAESQQKMNNMIGAMNEISDTSNEIGKIIKNIDDIAFQTNILALNAAVEAARAGSAGKGFAVVAEEVRNLAGKSAESAKSTADLIESALQAIENGSKIVAEAAQSLDKVVEGSVKTSDVIQQIADASEEQAKAAEQVNIGVSQISDVVQTNSATAEESAAASEELSGQAQMLKELIGRFELKESSDDNFRVEINETDSKDTEEEITNKNKNFKTTNYIDL